MLSTFRICAVAAAMALPSLAAAAAPAAVPSAEAPVTATLLFDPPLGQPMRYRYEKKKSDGARTQSEWSVNSYMFAARDGGYRLTITPLSSSRASLALGASPKVQAAVKRPYTLLLDADARFVGIEDEEAVWDATVDVLGAVLLATRADKAGDRAAVEGYVGMMRGLPTEARLAMLVEVASPIVEFANTENTIGKPLVSETEQESLIGTIKKQVTIALDKVEGGSAFISVKSSLPRAEIDRVLAGLVEQGFVVKPAGGGKPLPSDEEAGAGLVSAFEHFAHDGDAIFEVATDTGLLRRFRSVDTLEMREAGETSRSVTSVSLERID
jgi:hypothetical protein